MNGFCQVERQRQVRADFMVEVYFAGKWHLACECEWARS